MTKPVDTQGIWPTPAGNLVLGKDEDGYGGLVLHLSGPAGRVEWWRHGGVRVHGKAVAPGWYFALNCPVYGSGCWTNTACWESQSAWCDQTYRDNLWINEATARTEVYAVLAAIYRDIWLKSTTEPAR